MRFLRTLLASTAILALALNAAPVLSQATTSITITSAKVGNTPINGNVCFTATDENRNPIPVTTSGGGYYDQGGPFCQQLASGALAGALPVPNPATDSATNHWYRMVICDDSVGCSPPQYIRTIAGATWSLDTYIPPIVLPGSTISMGTTTTLAPGSAASCAIGGSAPNFTLSCGVPQGATGATGPAGANGTVTATGVGGNFAVPGALTAGTTMSNVQNSVPEALQRSQYLSSLNASFNEFSFTDGSGHCWYAGASLTSSGCFIDDLTLAYIGAPALFPAADIENVIGKFLAAADGSGECPVGITSAGAAVTFNSSFDLKHNRAAGDCQLMLPQAEYQAWQSSGSTAGISAHIAGIVAALATVPTDTNSLCLVSPSSLWNPWLFEETAITSGDHTMCSMWLARDYQVIASMYGAIGNSSQQTAYNAKLTSILASLGTSSPLWSAATGMYMLGTINNNNVPDIDGSSLGCYFGFAMASQCNAIASYINANAGILFTGGFEKQVPANFTYCGGIDASGNYSATIPGTLCDSGVYQQGYWTVQLGWTLATLNGYGYPALASTEAIAYATGGDPTLEWYSSGAFGQTRNLESTMGPYRFISLNWTQLPALTGQAISYPGNSGIGATVTLRGIGSGAGTPSCWDGAGNIDLCLGIPQLNFGNGVNFIPAQNGVAQCVGYTAFPDCSIIMARLTSSNDSLVHFFTGSGLGAGVASLTGYAMGMISGDTLFHIRSHNTTVGQTEFYLDAANNYAGLSAYGTGADGGCFGVGNYSGGASLNFKKWCVTGPTGIYPNEGMTLEDESGNYTAWYSRSGEWFGPSGLYGWWDSGPDPRASAGLLTTALCRVAAGIVGAMQPQGGADNTCGHGTFAAKEIELLDTTTGSPVYLKVTSGSVVISSTP